MCAQGQVCGTQEGASTEAAEHLHPSAVAQPVPHAAATQLRGHVLLACTQHLPMGSLCERRGVQRTPDAGQQEGWLMGRAP